MQIIIDYPFSVSDAQELRKLLDVAAPPKASPAPAAEEAPVKRGPGRPRKNPLPAPAPAPEPEPEPAVEEDDLDLEDLGEDEIEAPAVTREDVLRAARKLMADGKSAVLKKAVVRFDVKRVQDVPDENLNEFYAIITA